MASTSFPQMEESFPYPLGVNVADSFTLRLGPTNYFAWKQLMLRFLEGHKLSGFVDGTINPRKKPPPLLSEEKQETREKERQEDWNQQHMQEEGDTLSLEAWVFVEEKKKELHKSPEEGILEAHESPEEEEQERWKEWRRREEWRRKPEHRREREEEEHRIYRRWKRSDNLVRGWILATVRKELLPHVTPLATAREVWIELEKILTTPPFQLSHPELIDWKDQEIGQIVSQYEVLYKAALTADWRTAAKFLRGEPDAICRPITWCLETALIVAVRSANRNQFVRMVMEKMRPEDLALQDISGATALHAAVDGGNIEAADLLVQKNPELANIGDKDGTFAVHVAAGLGNREMVLFLLLHTTKLSETESAFKLLHSLASSELYDIALTFLQQHRNLASMKPSPLVVLAEKPTSFLSGTNFNLLERLIYSVIPLKLEDFENSTPEGDTENSTQEGDIETQQRDIAKDPPEPENPTQEREIGNPCKCCKDCCECIVFALIHVRHKLCSVVRVHCFQKLTALFWDVAEKLVPHIKSIRETKLKHYQALRLVKCLIEEVVKNTELRSATEIFTETVRMATRLGIHEIVEEIWGSFPWAKHLSSEKYRSLFHLAIEYRRENVFNLIYQMDENPDVILSMPDALKNNALHLAGNLRPQQQILLRASVAGAALQMQREIQWFKEVGNFILTRAKKQTNEGGQTPQDLFTETHKDLVKDGERWMKDTANSCTIVAALITTIVFAAAITVPGGSFSDSGSDKKGLPIRLGGRAFTVFGVSDALAMFSSSSSLLMFLSILTCRYGEEDFRYSLPRRLIIGLVTLFLSVISMMVAFGATLKIVFGEKTAWLLYPVAVLSSAPVALFSLWQFPLLYAMIKSTYFPDIFGKKSNRILY